jgi:hypothetical protein
MPTYAMDYRDSAAAAPPSATPAVASAEPAARMSEIVTDAASTYSLSDHALEDVVNNIMDMGYDRDQVRVLIVRGS